MFIDSGKRDVYAQHMTNQLTEFQRRFEKVMEHTGAAKNRAAFGTKLGLEGNQNQKLYNWYKRDQRVPDDQRRPLAALGISIDWLNEGEGEMLVEHAWATVSPPATAGEYVHVQHLDAAADMGDGQINDDYPEVIRAMDFTPAYIRSLVGFLPPPGRLVLVTGRGDSMIPIIQPGESLMVDTGVTSFDGDGIYLINTGNGQQVKGLQDRGDAIYVVSANAALYPAFAMPRSTVIGGKVYLRNRIERFN